MVSVDRGRFHNEGQLAYRYIVLKRGIGNLLKNLERTEGVLIVDWIAFIEWYKDGFPHWHIFVELETEGKAGMIGRESIKRHWPFGMYIREEYVKDEDHWKNITGYFDKAGYFEKGEGYQGKLPGWALDYHGKIRRWEAKRDRKASSRMRQVERSEVKPYKSMEVKASDWHMQTSYRVALEQCGQRCLMQVRGEHYRDEIMIDVPYREMKDHWQWEFKEGEGLVMEVAIKDMDVVYDEVEKRQAQQRERESRERTSEPSLTLREK